jgi:hypothetical protein
LYPQLCHNSNSASVEQPCQETRSRPNACHQHKCNLPKNQLTVPQLQLQPLKSPAVHTPFCPSHPWLEHGPLVVPQAFWHMQPFRPPLDVQIPKPFDGELTPSQPFSLQSPTSRFPQERPQEQPIKSPAVHPVDGSPSQPLEVQLPSWSAQTL